MACLLYTSLASMLVYAIVQQFDVWAYHKWWKWTEKKFGDRKRFLWVRNNGSTLISQFLNTLLFTFAAFWGVHSVPTLLGIVVSSYVIFIAVSYTHLDVYKRQVLRRPLRS